VEPGLRHARPRIVQETWAPTVLALLVSVWLPPAALRSADLGRARPAPVVVPLAGWAPD
jgi:hypothetical protein